jgi:hypothetical protein
MVWTTWENVGVDRMACAWFVRRFLDDDAQFAFVPYGQPLTQKEHTFDTPDAEYSHKRGRCSFAMMAKAHAPKDKAMLLLADIVDGADEASDALPPPESYGLEALCVGTRLKASGDADALLQGMALYDALLCYLKNRILERGEKP